MAKLEDLVPLAPTELRIYGVLTKLGKGTARDVNDHLMARLNLADDGGAGSTLIHTIMTLLQRMDDEGYLKTQRTHPPIPNVYTPRFPWRDVFRRGAARALDHLLVDRADFDLLLEYLFALPGGLVRVADDPRLQAATQRAVYAKILARHKKPDPFEEAWPEARFPGLEELRKAGSGTR
jgi:hypothetical protein